MNVKPTQKTTKLGTKLSFEVVDFRGQNGFPKGQRGLVFEYLENRTIRCRNTGREIQRRERYILRDTPCGKGWMLTRMVNYGMTSLNEAVYGLDRADMWDTNHEAAQALVEVLDEIEHNSTAF